MLRRFGFCFSAFLLSGAFSASVPAAPPGPNVTLIFADDQGTLGLNCFGSKDLYTPNKNKGERKADFFLSNMTRDVTETKNIAREHAQVVQELVELHRRWSTDVKSQ